MDGLFTPAKQKELELSFNEFLKRPENQQLAEQAQREELKQVLKQREHASLLDLRSKAEAAGPEVVEALSPYLHYPVLRRIVQTFANDPTGDLAAWARNPRVQAMLDQARRMLDEGSISNKELEFMLLQQLKAPTNPVSADFVEKTRQVAVLPADMLVSALNEHLSERRQGNERYRGGDLDGALQCYTRALSIVHVVRGSNASDQAEVDANKAAVLLNMAAVLLAQKQYGAAAERCSEALVLQPGCGRALMRRAKALVERRRFEEALRDMRAACEAEPSLEWEAEDLRARMRQLQQADAQHDRSLAARMFGRQRG